jgi:hypothetical protein
VTALGGSQHPDASRNDTLDGLSRLRMLNERGVLDTLLEFVTLWFLALLGGDGFVNVGGHAEVMRESFAVTRKFLAGAGCPSGVHLQAAECRFTSFLCDRFVTLALRERSPIFSPARGSENTPFCFLVQRWRPSSSGC